MMITWLLASIQGLTGAMTAIVGTLPATIIASSTTARITTMMTDAAITGVMTTGTTVIGGNNTVMNEIATMAITISVVTSTTVTYVLALNKDLGTVRPMKPVGAWSTILFMAPQVPSSSPTTYDTFWDFCDERSIVVKYISMAHPKANGQVEQANGMILDALNKRMYRENDQAPRQWIKELPAVVWGLQT
jgi:hypothetical protein